VAASLYLKKNKRLRNSVISYKIIKTLEISRVFKSCQADLNRRPPPYQGDALPTEPWQQIILSFHNYEFYQKKGWVSTLFSIF
jgi:hypothetical protein